jgi:hypothetical protein
MILICSYFVYADSVNYCDFPYNIFYSQSTGYIYLACAGDFDHLDLITIDPVTTSVVNNFRIGGLADAVVPVGNGNNLLVLLSELDDDPQTPEGVLRKINADTGVIVPGNEISFTEYPLTMVVDNMQNYAYVSVGLDYSPTSSIMKIDLSSFSILSPIVQFGEIPEVMALTNDDEKLYIKSEERLNTPGEPLHYAIGVVNTNDMTLNNSIETANVPPVQMVMGYDNRLYVSNHVPVEEHNSDISLMVIDTNNDTIIENISLNGSGIWVMKVDELNQKLYGLIWNRDVFLPQHNRTTFGPSPIIAQFDLNDPTYIPNYITLDDEGLWNFVIATIPGGSRLFAMATSNESPYIHYMDID